MINLNDKTARLRLIERYLEAETSPVEERLLAEYYLANPECAEPDEREVRDLILALHLTKADEPFQMSEEKERLFDELMAFQPNCHRSRKRILYASVATIAAVLSAVCFLLLRPSRTTDGVEITQITEVSDGQVYTESQIDAALKSEMASGHQQKMLDVEDNGYFENELSNKKSIIDKNVNTIPKEDSAHGYIIYDNTFIWKDLDGNVYMEYKF